MMQAVLWAVAVLLVWPLQYLVVVPLVLLWRVTLFAFKVGGVAILLLFLPIIGWVILFFMLLKRRDDRNYQGLLETENHQSIWRPWMLDTLRTA